MRKSTFFNRTRKEIDLLKVNATVEEIDKLNFNNLDPVSRYHCIYGQMTSDCNSERAFELINLCCHTKTSFMDVADNIDSCEIPVILNVSPRRRIDSYSYLEACICSFPNNNENIIKYLKGEIEELGLETCEA